MRNTIDTTSFGKNDIRGIYGQNVTEELFYYTGKGYVKYVMGLSSTPVQSIWVTVAQDVRHHSKSLSESLIKGLIEAGVNVIDLGVVPTPLGYYSEFAGVDKSLTYDHSISGSLIITASHNPKEYNGLKMTFNKSSLNESEIKQVKKYTEELMEKDENAVRFGVCKQFDIIPNYIDAMVKKFGNIGKGIKVVTDCANATAGVLAPDLYRALGCEVVELYTTPDGDFPNHHPNPSDEKTLTDIKKAVVDNNADLGLAFDGDSDRIGVIDARGYSLSGDKLLLIYALDIISDLKVRGEVPKIVSEVKCSQVLYDTINASGGQAIMQKTGHGFIKSKMKEESAILAGEMSGHMFFKDRYYGFDDALYAGCRIVEIVAKQKAKEGSFKLQNLLTAFDGVFTSPEVRFECPNDKKQSVLNALESKIHSDMGIFEEPIKEIITIDGMRVVFADGFALIRQSNTEPVFTLRFEAHSDANCKKYERVMLTLLEQCM